MKIDKEMIGTFIFVVGICVAALVVLFFSKALDSEGATMRFNAESVCFIGGHYDGLIVFKPGANHTYEFACDTSKSTVVEFDGTKGVIKYVNTQKK